MPIKVIDLFSGPGGLGEGFSNCKNPDGSTAFEIAISIEKEKSAHATLKLRAFYRQFGKNVPKEYYDFMKGKLGKSPDEKLYSLFPEQLRKAETEALCLTLGKQNKTIYSKIRNAIGEDNCVLIGGPPCQAYSLVGRSRNMGIKDYKANEDHRNYLYLEYLKVIAKFQPTIFVMENVRGMLSAKVDGQPIFDSIYRDLKNPCSAANVRPEGRRKKHKYKLFSLVSPNDNAEEHDRNPQDFIIFSEHHNVPQRRHRVIILGIREDHAHKWNDSLLLTKGDREISVGDILKGLPVLRSGLSKINNHTAEDWINEVLNIRKKVLPALKKSKDIKHKLVAQQIERIIQEFVIPEHQQGKLFGLTAAPVNTGNTELDKWIHQPNLGGFITNHETRKHITSDLYRYLFCSAWAMVAIREGWSSKTPKSNDYIKELIPNHANFSSGKFADRFRVQAECDAATTITSHISKDGHYYIHPDPNQCRSLTVREAARIQTFPDDYFFVGNRTEQYVQVGNAVPPYLALQIGTIVNTLFN
ncbi:DNA cytosine methyltransferase [Reinekea sp. G2M2-21]|uniref:DNA cytosine methyltransferase n=1 Tax=Reinekea sp. G2M2-21 TaxID=2788942 RepID=UPI0018AB852C|nr:DNA (cytosine-5-)-methyltransferase [Reinekea sp. G2M2-21]